MRLWIEHIFQNSEAHADFLTWFVELERTLFHKMQDALLQGDKHMATGIAFELHTYQTIVDSFKAETREHRKQISRRIANA